MSVQNPQLVYPAHSKHNFYFTAHISAFVLKHGCVPLNPFMLFQYYMLDVVDRDLVKRANDTLIARCDQLWVIGEMSDGVSREIRQAHELGKEIKYFSISETGTILECEFTELSHEKAA